MITGILTLGGMNLGKLAADLSGCPNQCNTARGKKKIKKLIAGFTENMKLGLMIFFNYMYLVSFEMMLN